MYKIIHASLKHINELYTTLILKQTKNNNNKNTIVTKTKTLIIMIKYTVSFYDYYMCLHFQALVICANGTGTSNKILSVKKQFTGEKVTDRNYL